MPKTKDGGYILDDSDLEPYKADDDKEKKNELEKFQKQKEQ